MGSELIFRGHESQPVSDAYSPKRRKPWLSDIRPIRYMLREQRLVFLFVGIAIATLVFILRPSSNSPAPIGYSYFSSELTQPHRAIYQNGHLINGFGFNSVGKFRLD
ncbi:UNVERIFIED_CONTAM: UDP-glucuronic acid decarboxylase 2 [Sesamum calycinum]|uniref:UDP-glucuronic acid decarboxylase 2 n=1 Tax=Sesamum calycinum TaxID=2727403 RepID=A0AAW2LAN8_9LAMI